MAYIKVKKSTQPAPTIDDDFVYMEQLRKTADVLIHPDHKATRSGNYQGLLELALDKAYRGKYITTVDLLVTAYHGEDKQAAEEAERLLVAHGWQSLFG